MGCVSKLGVSTSNDLPSPPQISGSELLFFVVFVDDNAMRVFLTVALTVWLTPAWAVISNVAHTAVASGASPAFDSTGASVLIIVEGRFGSDPLAPTDNQGNVMTPLLVHTTAGANYHVRAWYVCGPVTSASHTVTPGTSTYTFIGAWSGTATSNCFDAGTDQGAKSTAATSPLPAITPSLSGDLVMSASYENTTGSESISVDHSLVVTDRKLTNPAAAMAWVEYDSTASLTVSWTVGFTFDNEMIIAAFLPAGGATATPAPTKRKKLLNMMGEDPPVW